MRGGFFKSGCEAGEQEAQKSLRSKRPEKRPGSFRSQAPCTCLLRSRRGYSFPSVPFAGRARYNHGMRDTDTTELQRQRGRQMILDDPQRRGAGVLSCPMRVRNCPRGGFTTPPRSGGTGRTNRISRSRLAIILSQGRVKRVGQNGGVGQNTAHIVRRGDK
jgi:hypothetical protein